ncbi:MAG: SPW repeat protein [Trueperaceae bacterium]|nr:SPW repeat protein [Trueperaceae bacterium]
MLPGVWLLIAPVALGYAGLPDPLWNAVLVGAAITISAAARAIGGGGVPVLGCIWNQVALGAWLLVAPWVLGYGDVTIAVMSDLVAGALTLALIWRGMRRRAGA